MSYYDLECPYCGHQQEVCHDDGFGYEEDVAHEDYCQSCDTGFVFYTSISYTYYPRKADCLNGKDHQWDTTGRTILHPEHRRCKQCDKLEEGRVDWEEYEEHVRKRR